MGSCHGSLYLGAVRGVSGKMGTWVSPEGDEKTRHPGGEDSIGKAWRPEGCLGRVGTE